MALATAAVFGIVVVVLALSGNWVLAVPLALVGAIIANRMGRRQTR